MVSLSKIKSVDFYRKIPRDLAGSSLSGPRLFYVAALFMLFLFGCSPALSCEFASVDVSDVQGTNKLNITTKCCRFNFNSHLRPTGAEFHSEIVANAVKHDFEVDEEPVEGSVSLTAQSFDKYVHQFPITVVFFYAPWCLGYKMMKPSWEKAAKTTKERYDPEIDGRIILVKVNCTQEADLCRRNHIQGSPSIRIFHNGSDLRSDHGQHGHESYYGDQEHETYYGDRDTESLVKMAENLVASLPTESQKPALEDKSNTAENAKRPAILSLSDDETPYLTKTMEHRESRKMMKHFTIDA